MTTLKSIRGFHDIHETITTWQQVEQIMKSLASQYGYNEIRTPMLEDSRLFERSIGATSDIVHKEMYTFNDKNEQSVSLRPEGTAAVVRSCIENNLLYTQPRKYYYLGSMFRRERPQRGRLRQFHQFGLECLGYEEPYADVEQLCIIQRLWRTLGIEDKITLEINYIGSQATRATYTAALKEYYKPHKEQMSDIDQIRWQDNTLRLLDSKASMLVELNKNAPTIDKFYSEKEIEIVKLIELLCQENHINYTHNRRLMRGLDYYSGLIYEWKSECLGAQGTVCGGGRYDQLFEQLGAQRTGACGFSIGIERLIELTGELNPLLDQPCIHLITPTDTTLPKLMTLVESLRDTLPTHQFYLHTQCGKIGSMIKKALKMKANAIIILGDEELKEAVVTMKQLDTQEQRTVAITELADTINEILPCIH
jgi:histidyl-tRNA synthetase